MAVCSCLQLWGPPLPAFPMKACQDPHCPSPTSSRGLEPSPPWPPRAVIPRGNESQAASSSLSQMPFLGISPWSSSSAQGVGQLASEAWVTGAGAGPASVSPTILESQHALSLSRVGHQPSCVITCPKILKLFSELSSGGLSGS